jgi:adenylate kinase family enzyme
VSGQPMLIIVSGAPGTGKSTLAHSLRHVLGCPVISRDEIREGLVRARTPDAGFLLTYRLFVRAVTIFADAGVTFIAEAAFQHHNWQPLLDLGPTRIIRCVCAEQRVVRRAAHPGEPIGIDDWVPISSLAPTLIVDTTDGYSPGLDEIVAFTND